MEYHERQMLNHQRVQELETWLRVTKIKLVQVNGQRKYGGPPQDWNGPPPGSRCEVFINQIPRDTYEDLLLPLFSSVGPLWEFRLMMNFSGQNRGFAYAKYGSPIVASRAISQLQGYMIEPGSFLSISLSTEKKNLCIMGLPAATKPEILLKVLQEMTEGVERVSLKTEQGVDGITATVVFSSHYTASMGKKVLIEAFQRDYALSITVQWQVSLQADRRNPGKKWLSKSPSPPTHFPDIPPGFCRAVGGPIALQTLPSPPSSSSSSGSDSSQRYPMPGGVSPVMLLQNLCEVAGVGQPQYEFQINHCGSNGFLHIRYKVTIPRVTMAFGGTVMVFPGESANCLLERSKRAAAHQVLLRFWLQTPARMPEKK